MTLNLLDSFNDILVKGSQAILEVKNSIDHKQVLRVLELLSSRTGKVITTGCGTSGMAAKKIAHTFNCIECPTVYLSPTDAVHGGLGVVEKGDILIAFSKGGATQELNQLIPGAKKKGAILVAVTEAADSYMALESEYPLIIKVERESDEFNMLATSSTLAIIAVFDAITIALSRKSGFTKEKFSIIHPGGKSENDFWKKTL